MWWLPLITASDIYLSVFRPRYVVRGIKRRRRNPFAVHGFGRIRVHRASGPAASHCAGDLPTRRDRGGRSAGRHLEAEEGVSGAGGVPPRSGQRPCAPGGGRRRLRLVRVRPRRAGVARAALHAPEERAHAPGSRRPAHPARAHPAHEEPRRVGLAALRAASQGPLGDTEHLVRGPGRRRRGPAGRGPGCPLLRGGPAREDPDGRRRRRAVERRRKLLVLRIGAPPEPGGGPGGAPGSRPHPRGCAGSPGQAACDRGGRPHGDRRGRDPGDLGARAPPPPRPADRHALRHGQVLPARLGDAGDPPDRRGVPAGASWPSPCAWRWARS
jgi:hypothetical protein